MITKRFLPVFWGLFFVFFWIFSLSAREITFTVLPSGDLKKKSDAESARDLQNFSNNLSRDGNERCSRGVREAIKAEYGIDIFDSAKPGDLVINNGRYAATVGGLDAMLKRNGYVMINSKNYVPQKGDVQGIAFLKPVRGRSGMAHAQYYDGMRWISDHQQTSSYADPQLLAQLGMTPNDVQVLTYRRKQ